ASEAFLWLSYLPVLGVLMLLRRGWAMLVLMTSALLCLALGLLPEGGANHLALVLTLLLTVVMLRNRPYSFWLRLSWRLYVLAVDTQAASAAVTATGAGQDAAGRLCLAAGLLAGGAGCPAATPAPPLVDIAARLALTLRRPATGRCQLITSTELELGTECYV